MNKFIHQVRVGDVEVRVEADDQSATFSFNGTTTKGLVVLGMEKDASALAEGILQLVEKVKGYRKVVTEAPDWTRRNRV